MQNEVNVLQRKIDDGDWKAQLASEVNKKLEFVSIVEDGTIIWHPLLKDIESAMVPGVTVSALVFSNLGDIHLSGNTDSLKSIADFLGSIQTQTGLEVIRFHNASAGGGFQITMKGYRQGVLEDE